MDTTRATVVGVFEDRAAAEAALQDLRAHGFPDPDIGYAIRSATPSSPSTAAYASGVITAPTPDPVVNIPSPGTAPTIGVPPESTTVPAGIVDATSPLTTPSVSATAIPAYPSYPAIPPGATDLTQEETSAGAATGAITGGVLGGLIGVAAALLVPGVGPVIAGGILASALGGAAIGAAAGGLLGALVGLGVPEEEARHYEGEFHAGRAVVTVRAEHRYPEAHSILQRHGATNLQSSTDQSLTLT